MNSMVRLAWRNLGRNRRRTAITVFALAFAIALCVGSYGVTDGLNASMLETLTRLELGHVQVHHAKFPKKRQLTETIDDAPRVLKAIASLGPRLGGKATMRLYGAALVSRGEKSAGVQLVGVVPETERQVTVLHKLLARGRYLDDAPTPWPRGRKLTDAERERDRTITKKVEKDVLDELDSLPTLKPKAPAPDAPKTPAPNAPTSNGPTKTDATRKPDATKKTDATKNVGPHGRTALKSETLELANKLSPPPVRPPRVIIGTSLARILKVKVGETIYALTQTVDGMMAEVHFEVAGIFKTGSNQYDRTRIYMHLGDLQRMLHLYDRVHEIALVTHDAKLANETAATLKAKLSDDKLIVRSWSVIRPDVERMLKLNKVSTAIMIFIIFFVATLGVVNTMLMAVFERTREFGVLKAIGMSAMRLFNLVVIETLVLVAFSAVVGTIFGLLLDGYLVVYGLDLRSFTDGISIMGIGIAPVLKGKVTLSGLLIPSLILGISCFVASFYPAQRAARMLPAAGMREL